MKKNLRLLAFVAVGAAASLGFSSCAYDPYYGSSTVGGSYSSGGGYSVGGSYSSGYGEGYGYGGSGFNTSVFVSTGDPRWGYDPYCYSYYDYSRRCYYDPYLNGYYPIGYRPAVVYGVPHPYGWSGHGYCPPPRHVTNVTVVNYRNREAAYHSTNYGWAKQVRQQVPSSSRSQQQGNSRQVYSARPQANSGYQNQSRPQASQPSRYSSQSSSRQQTQSRYNSPVTTYSQQPKGSQHNNYKNQSQANQRPQLGNPGNGRNQPVPQQTRSQGGKNKGQDTTDNNGKPIRGYR